MRQQTYEQSLKDQGRDQSAARGVVIALMLSIPLWIIIVGVGYWWLL